MRRHAFALAALLVFSASVPKSHAQTLAQRANAVRDGIVLMAFQARAGVCGNSNGSIWPRDSWSNSGSWNQTVCLPGPVRVSLGRADGATISVRTFVGGAWRATSSETDLGVVSPAEAAHYLAGIAHSIGGRSGNDAVSAAALSDAPDTSPDLVSLVRDANAPLEARKQALFWAGNTSLSTRDLVQLYDALWPFSLREHFVFVISQRRDDAAVDKLIDVARRDADLEIRKRAMYWLGQTQDPRAMKFLRDLVTR
jgi:hypothetical protein